MNIPEYIAVINRQAIQIREIQTNTIGEIGLDESSIAYLEVIDSHELQERIGLFFEKNKISSGSVVVIVSDELIFESKKSEQNDVPFRSIISVPSTANENENVLVTNRQLIEIIGIAMHSHGLQIDAILPERILPKNSDASRIKKIKKRDIEIVDYNKQLTINNKETFNNKRYFSKTGLITIALLIALILMVIAYRSYSDNPTPIGELLDTQATIKFSPTPSVAAAVSNERIAMVINPTGKLPITNKVRKILSETDITNIRTNNEVDITENSPQITVVQFSDNISTDDKNEIINALEGVFERLVVESSKDTYDITITIGKEK